MRRNLETKYNNNKTNTLYNSQISNNLSHYINSILRNIKQLFFNYID